MARDLWLPLAHLAPRLKRFASLRAGGYWLPEIAKEIAEATAFVLLVGEKGLGPWQVLEYYEALDRRVKEPDFPVVFVLLDGQPERRLRVPCREDAYPLSLYLFLKPCRR